MTCDDSRPTRAAEPSPEVAELPFLLPWGDLLRLEERAAAADLTASQLLRRLVRAYLRGQPEGVRRSAGLPALDPALVETVRDC